VFRTERRLDKGVERLRRKHGEKAWELEGSFGVLIQKVRDIGGIGKCWIMVVCVDLCSLWYECR
jgi:hypothetical protein